MTDATTLQELLRRVEGAADGSRELDCLLATVADFYFIDGERYDEPVYCIVRDDGETQRPGQSGDMLVPEYTTSTDAAIELLEKRLPGKFWNLGSSTFRDSYPRPYCADIAFPGVTPEREGATPALALIAALLSALIAQANAPRELA